MERDGEREKEIYFMEFIIVIMNDDKLKICRVWLMADWRKWAKQYYIHLKAFWLQNSCFLKAGALLPLVLLDPSTGLKHIEEKFVYSKSTGLNVAMV